MLVSIGDELGFYKTLANGALTAGELAAKTGTNERYVREWLANQAAGGYVEYDAATQKFSLSPEQDPAGAARHARTSLAPDGHAMIVEPYAHDRLEQNLNPVGRVYYGASTMVCVPVSMAKKGPALGAQAGEERLRDVFVRQAGFGKMRRATETPFNIILEARP